MAASVPEIVVTDVAICTSVTTISGTDAAICTSVTTISGTDVAICTSVPEIVVTDVQVAASVPEIVVTPFCVSERSRDSSVGEEKRPTCRTGCCEGGWVPVVRDGDYSEVLLKAVTDLRVL
jgi:Ca2+/Na+ antiporter